MKAHLEAIDNRVACHDKAYCLRVTLEPESYAEAMRLGSLSQTLRKIGLWCIVHPESGQLTIRAAAAEAEGGDEDG